MTGGEILVRCLERQGVSTITGMPGNQNIWIYDALRDSDIQSYLIRNEQGATLIANGYARASGDVGVALTVPGPGSTNASTGLVDAHTDSVPVLLVTGGTEVAYDGRDRSKCFHGLDQAAFFAPITRAFERPGSVEEIPSAVERVFAALRAPRPGPAVLELPVDVAAQEGSVDIPDRVDVSVPDPDSSEIARVAAAIREYSRPVILVGKNVADTDAVTEVIALAERLQAPVLFTRLGKGALPDNHPNVFGHCHARVGRQLLSEADGLIAIGCRFTQIDTRSWQLPIPERIVQLDVDPSEVGREYDVEAGAAGSLSISLTELTTQLGASENTWLDHGNQAAAAIREQLQPLEFFSSIRKHVPDDTIFSVDVTAFGYRTFDELPVYQPRSYLYPCHSVTLGFALPAAIGARLACPSRPVVAFCGDGGYQMTSFELATAVEHGIDITVVVINDGSLSAIRGSQAKTFDGRVIDTDMRVPQLADAATAFGARGIRIDNPDRFETVFADTVGLDGPTVIEVMMAEQRDDIIQRVPWLYPD